MFFGDPSLKWIVLPIAVQEFTMEWNPDSVFRSEISHLGSLVLAGHTNLTELFHGTFFVNGHEAFGELVLPLVIGHVIVIPTRGWAHRLGEHAIVTMIRIHLRKIYFFVIGMHFISMRLYSYQRLDIHSSNYLRIWQESKRLFTEHNVNASWDSRKARSYWRSIFFYACIFQPLLKYVV